MGYRYIGSKTKITQEIISRVKQLVPQRARVADIMCGTGSISLELRRNGYTVLANDVMTQAYHITKAKVLLQKPPPFENIELESNSTKQFTLDTSPKYFELINTLNSLEPVEGYFWREFSPSGKPMNGTDPRKYFTSENAMKIDAIRNFINRLVNSGRLTPIEHSLLVHDLIVAANDVANIAGTYGHYLSKFNPRALEQLKLKPMTFIKGGDTEGHKISNDYAEVVAKSITADLCYIDPPYIKRQYAANYHLLETIAKGDEPVANGKSGLRPWRDQYSNFCSKVLFKPSFEKIITSMDCDNFLISYSSEGLFSIEQLCNFFNNFGKVEVLKFNNKRFKSRNESAEADITEFLVTLRRRN